MTDLKPTKMNSQLALPIASQRKNYYVSFYNGSPLYENRTFFLSFYGKDFESEKAAKIRAFKSFRNSCFDDCTTITLTEHNGMQIADKNEPYGLKSAIVRTLVVKNIH